MQRSKMASPYHFELLIAVIQGDVARMMQSWEKLGFHWPECTCRTAAMHGKFECLKRAHQSGAPLGDDASVCEFAASFGQLDCLEYAHEHGVPWGRTCMCAAQGGHLACLQFAHKHGAPLVLEEDTLYTSESELPLFEDTDSRTANTCAAAAFKGDLGCLKYAHEEGAPWDLRTCVFAAMNGHESCLRYAFLLGAPWPSATPEMVAWREQVRTKAALLWSRRACIGGLSHRGLTETRLYELVGAL